MICSASAVYDSHSFIKISELISIIHAIAAKENIYEAVMMIYGSKYPTIKRNELIELFLSYPSFRFAYTYHHSFPSQFREQYQNTNFLYTLQLVHFKNKRDIILASDDAINITQFAEFVGKYYIDCVIMQDSCEIQGVHHRFDNFFSIMKQDIF